MCRNERAELLERCLRLERALYQAERERDAWKKRAEGRWRRVYKPVVVESERVCRLCQKSKPIEKYQIAGRGYRRRVCTACHAKQNRQRSAYKEHYRQYQIEYRKQKRAAR